MGLEVLAHGLRRRGFSVSILDLCFSEDPLGETGRGVRKFHPDAVGVTVRNVDTALYPGTESFLPAIRDVIARIRHVADVPVLIGGAGIGVDPEGVRAYLGADLAVRGPGEETMAEILAPEAPPYSSGPRIRQGRTPEAGFCAARGKELAYASYLAEDGIAGFETHKGCSSRCSYCIEAGSPVMLREPAAVVSEIHGLVSAGYREFHLLDPEFNENIEHCRMFLRELIEKGPAIRWALYMKPGKTGSDFFTLLARSGAFLVTLTVDSDGRSTAYFKTVSELVGRARAAGLRVAIDFLGGFPGGADGALPEALDRIEATGADDIVVNSMLRLYPALLVTQRVLGDPGSHAIHLLRGDGRPGPLEDLLEPVFYGRVTQERLAEMIAGRRNFRMAGRERVVNYQKAERGDGETCGGA